MPKVGDREVKVCAWTELPVVMEYTGDLLDDASGHRGWLCLHGDCVEDDARDVADFLAGRKPKEQVAKGGKANGSRLVLLS